MRNATLPLAVGVAILGCVLAIYANMNSVDLKNVVDGERSKRFAAEKQLLKVQQKAKVLEAELGDAKSKMASIEKILTDGKVAEQELLSELDTIKKEREALKQQLGSEAVSESAVMN